MRADLNQHLRPEISELASGFLAELTDGRYSELELDDDYNVVVLEDGIPKPVISGGEEDLANLVLRLASPDDRGARGTGVFAARPREVFGSLTKGDAAMSWSCSVACTIASSRWSDHAHRVRARRLGSRHDRAL